MYSTIRLIILSLAVGTGIILIRKSKMRSRRLPYIALISIAVILTFALPFLPVENLFITFDSVEAAYDYCNFGDSDIQLVVEGKVCDLVIDREDETTEKQLLIPKTADGWKIGLGSDTNRVISKVFDECTVLVFQYKDTSDYFIMVSFFGRDAEAVISDDFNTKFYSQKSIMKTNVMEVTDLTYYAYIPYYDEQYSINVNGRELAVL